MAEKLTDHIWTLKELAHVRLKMNIYKKKHIMNYDDNIFDK
jgi:hypothetical protein